MAAFMVSLIVMLAMAGHSNAAYCICKDGVGDSVLQKNIDYACGNGADCTPILQNGPCFNPNTVKDHCNWAVNSYYQRKGQAGASCDFQGSATLSQNPPSQSSSCAFPSGPSNTGTINTPPTTLAPPSTQNPGTGVPTGTGTGVPTGTGTGTGTPTTTIPGTGVGGTGFGLAPSGSGMGSTDSSGSVTLGKSTSLFIFTCLALVLLSGSSC